MIKRYPIETPEQLRALYALEPVGNLGMDNLARVWKAQDVLRSANHGNPPLPSMAYIDFDTIPRRATVYKTIHGKVEAIGRMPYNKALKYCRENLEMEGLA